MRNENLLEKKEWVRGEAKPIEITVRHLLGADLTGATCSIEIFDSEEASVYTANITPTISTSRAEIASANLTTDGGTPTFANLGNYTAAITFVVGTLKRVWKVPIEVVTQKS
jgi:hypothetical protein